MEYREIINNLMSDGVIYRCQGILVCLKRRIVDPDIVEIIKGLKNDRVVIMGRKVSSYAQATLGILGIEPYDGDDAEEKEFIPELIKYTSG